MTSDAAKALAEFHEFYGRDDPILGLRLRLTLINEEHAELVDEVRADWTHGLTYDRQKLYKELADLIYVCYGLDLHLGGHLDRALAEVHRSNMTKLWPCENCGGRGIIYMQDCAVLNCWNCTCKMECPKCHGEGKVVRRREDGKILKPPTYQPPDLSFVEEPHVS